MKIRGALAFAIAVLASTALMADPGNASGQPVMPSGDTDHETTGAWTQCDRKIGASERCVAIDHVGNSDKPLQALRVCEGGSRRSEDMPRYCTWRTVEGKLYDGVVKSVVEERAHARALKDLRAGFRVSRGTGNQRATYFIEETDACPLVSKIGGEGSGAGFQDLKDWAEILERRLACTKAPPVPPK